MTHNFQTTGHLMSLNIKFLGNINQKESHAEVFRMRTPLDHSTQRCFVWGPGRSSIDCPENIYLAEPILSREGQNSSCTLVAWGNAS
jgi:hypothetical protein